MKKEENRGGANRNQGLRPGTYKNAEKSEEKRRTIRKTYRFSQVERQTIEKAVLVSGIEESKIVREGALKEAQRLIEKNSQADV